MVNQEETWDSAQKALFDIVRAWVKTENEDSYDAVAHECLHIMEEVNETTGAPFIFVCELARMLAVFIARYMAALNEEIPTREEIMRELDVLEMDYVEEFVMAEMEQDEEPGEAGLSRRPGTGTSRLGVSRVP